jgi:hypothetical protein
MQIVCQIETQYIFQIISQGEKSTTCTKNMLKVLTKTGILLHMHILQEYGRNDSTMSVFLRIKGWGFSLYVLILNQEEINMKESLSTMKIYYQYFHFMSCAYSIVKALQEHQNQQSSERKKLYKHRTKCYDAPNKYLGMIIDGMDQKKTLLPHFFHTPKNLQEENFILLRTKYQYSIEKPHKKYSMP